MLCNIRCRRQAIGDYSGVVLKLSGVTTFKMLGVTALAISMVSTWPGCKGTGADPGSASSARHAPSAITAAHVGSVSAAQMLADPLTSPVWQTAAWQTLGPAPGHAVTPNLTRVATAWGNNDLYAAFVCVGSSGSDKPQLASELWRHESVEFWLDTSRKQNGTDFLEIVAAPNGQWYEAQHRSADAPQPRSDGQLNLSHPFSIISMKTAGLAVYTGRGTYKGQPAWTVVVRVPLAQLPQRLRTVPAQGERFKANFIRYDWRVGDDGHRKLVQSNLFPVPTAAQGFAPYLMGELVIGPNSPYADVTLDSYPSSNNP